MDLRSAEKEAPLRSAARWGKWPSCSSLIEHGARAKVESKNRNAHAELAKELGCEKALSVLRNALAIGQLNLRDLSLQTAYFAAAHGMIDLTASLIEILIISRNAHGFETCGWAIIFCCCWHGALICARAAMKARANSKLHFFSQLSSCDCWRMPLQRGARRCRGHH